MNYLHGVEVTQGQEPGSSVVSVPSAVIALVGTAYQGAANEVIICNNANDDSLFGAQNPLSTIPQALAAIRKQHPKARVAVVNIADTDDAVAIDGVAAVQLISPSTNPYTDYMTYRPDAGSVVVKNVAETPTFVLGTDYLFNYATGGFQLPVVEGAITDGDDVKVFYTHRPTYTITNMAVVLDDVPFGAAPVITNLTNTLVTYTEGTDYTIDQYGIVHILASGALTEGDKIMVSYDKMPTVSSSSIEGTASPRTGLYVYETMDDVYGYTPTVLIVPVYTALSGVVDLMRTFCESYKAICLVDSEVGWTVANVLTNRGLASTSIFNVRDSRVQLCYPQVNAVSPYLEAVNAATNGTGTVTELRPMSQYVAGMLSKTDSVFNFGRAYSNIYDLNGVESKELDLSASDIQSLNEVGVTTLKNKSWVFGVRSSKFHGTSDTAVLTFISVQRAKSIVEESLRRNFEQYVDQPIRQSLITTMLQSGNAYLNGLIANGSILDGSLSYDENDNPAAELALGHLTFGLEVTYSVPAEKITVRSSISLNFSSLTA